MKEILTALMIWLGANTQFDTNFDIPINWMLVKLMLETGPVVGATMPGIPLIFNGRSQYSS